MIYGRIFRHLFFPLYETVLRRRPTGRYIREYLQSARKAPDEIATTSDAKLVDLLQYCWSNIDYYRETWQQQGIDVDDLTSPSVLARLPLLTKTIIKENLRKLQAERFPAGRVDKATGGSTGTPLKFSYDRLSDFRRIAVMWRGYGWAGVQRGERTLYLWGTALGSQSQRASLKERLHNALYNRKLLSCFEMSEQQLAEYRQTYNRYRPKNVVGYVSALVDFARYLADHPDENWQPQSVIAGAEPLREADRTIIERGFGAPLFNTYGCREFMLIAAECDQHQGLHINSDHLRVEVLNDSGQAVESQLGRVVVTDLSNRGMPFVRYELGDEAILDTTPCPCGLPFPRLRSIEGRVLDALQTPAGKRVPGEFFPHLIKEIGSVLHYQVVQEAVDELTIFLVVNGDYDKQDEMFLREQTAQIFGEEMNLRFQYPERLEKTVSGKRRVTINRVKSNGG